MLNKDVSTLQAKIQKLKKKNMEREIIQEGVLKDLSEEYDIASIEKAEKIHKRNTKQIASKQEELQEEYNGFIEKYEEQLEEL